MSISQIIFISTIVITLCAFTYSVLRIVRFFKLTKKYSVKNLGKRIIIVLKIAFGQTKIFRFPFAGILHATVFWGFLVILFGSVEMVIDGILGKHKTFIVLGVFYDIIMGFGDVFAFLILIATIVFILRRVSHKINRFKGNEMTLKSHADALIALVLIFLLMFSLIGMNTMEAIINPHNPYLVSNFISSFIPFCTCTAEVLYTIFWWIHIELIFIFANILPYSKHFHIFMSIPNVFFSRLEPLGKLNTMPSITKEVQLLMNGETDLTLQENTEPERFGMKDVEDVTWKTYMDALTCTQCGRCTSVCPAAQTGRKLSPRKLIMNLRYRMNEKGPNLIKNKGYDDKKSYLGDYISLEEIWACTLCNACAQECPLNIYHPQIIIDLRRYLVLEEGKAQKGLQALFANIENNGAPWQYSPSERLNWINS